MGISNASLRRLPFIREPQDVSDLPIEDDTVPPPATTTAPDPSSPQFIGPPTPPQKLWNKLGLNWQSGLIGLGVLATLGYGGVKVYQINRATLSGGVAAGAAGGPLALNSTTALNAPRTTPARPPQPQTAPPPASVADATAPQKAPAPTALEAPQQAAPPAPAPLRPSATEIMTENRKIVALPMMGDDQRQVLDLVAATNSVVLQLKHQVEDDHSRMREMQARIDDVKQMVSLSQAKMLSAATQIAMGNIQPAPSAQPSAPPAPDAQPSAPQDPNPGPACRLKPSYIVASASPAHATLKGSGQVWLSIRAPSKDYPQGDSIPCYGRVLEITQENSRWVVKTDRNVIGRN